MKVAIQDANILIDLETAGLFDLWLQVGIETHTSDLVRWELDRGNHVQALSYLDSGAIHCHALDEDELAAVEGLHAEVGGGVSLVDCSVIYLAERLGAMLLSGDKALVRMARDRQVEGHGTLWLFDLLVNRSVLMPRLAAAKLKHLLASGRFLPKPECEARITRWGGRS